MNEKGKERKVENGEPSWSRGAEEEQFGWLSADDT